LKSLLKQGELEPCVS